MSSKLHRVMILVLKIILYPLLALGILAAVVAAYISYNIWTKSQEVPPKPCEPLVVENGFVTIKTEDSGITLRLPNYADIRRYSDRGCDIADNFGINYLWHEGQLVPEGTYQSKVPKNKYSPVRLFFRGSVADIQTLKEPIKKPWNFEPALPHKKYQLEFYPRYYWDDPINPSSQSLNRSRLDFMWGVRNTRYKQVGSNLPFLTTCGIPATDPSDSNSRIHGDIRSNCRGWVNASEDGKALFFMIDVWAGHRDTYRGIDDINHIYDAAVEELKSFLQE